MLIRCLSHDQAFVLDPSSPLIDCQPLAALAVSNALHHSLRVHSDLDVESRIDLGVSNLACPAAHGGGARTHDTLAG